MKPFHLQHLHIISYQTIWEKILLMLRILTIWQYSSFIETGRLTLCHVKLFASSWAILTCLHIWRAADISSALLSIYDSMQCWTELLHLPQQSAGFCSSFLGAAPWSSRQAVISSMILRPFPATHCPLLKEGAAATSSKCRQQTNSFFLLLSNLLLGLTLCEAADNTAGLDLPKAVAVPLIFPLPLPQGQHLVSP